LRLAERQFKRVERLTHGSNNLGLHTKLVRETPREIANAAPAIACNVGHLADMVEHMSTCEEEDKDQADRSPEVAILEDRYQVWPHNAQKGE
jgi:hypothetical protein